MNNGQLKARLIEISQRDDLDDHVQNFINQATARINRRFCTTYSNMSQNADSNGLLANFEDIYIYAGMVELSHFIRDWEDHDRYNNKYMEEADRQNINANEALWGTPQLYIKTEAEQAIGD